MLFFGRQFNFPIALEAALKVKEITYLYAEGHPSAELKHRHQLLWVKPELPSVFIAPDDAVFFSKNMNNVEQVRARKGPIIAVTTAIAARLSLRTWRDDIITVS
jgi:glucosamine--fructose-6-phosphate aminotransferase (isomerizing)